MLAQNRPGIRPETLTRLLDAASDPRRLGGVERAFGISRRSPWGEEYKAFFGHELRTFQDLHDFFSSMLEEEGLRLLERLGARMPDTTRNTVFETVRRLHEAA